MDYFIAEGARIINDVRIGKDSSIWYNAVLRGDINYISIGRSTNVQDNVTCHVADKEPCIIGDYVTIGHNAIIHGCQVKDNCLIGMGACILNGAVIGENSIVGANSLVLQDTIIPANSLVVGSPAKVIRTLGPEDAEKIKESAIKYEKLWKNQYI